jgi:hypothetical protein
VLFLHTGSRLRMRLEGASGRARLRPSRRLPGIVNEFLGNDPRRWRTSLPTFSGLQAQDVYPGIDLAFRGRRGALEYDFLLAPGADPGRIALRFSGQRGLRLDAQGNLLLRLRGSELRQLRPRAFQEGRSVPARFRLRGKGRVGFAVGRYDHSRPLVLDPAVPYSTYLGGSGHDTGRAIAVDSAGSAYLTGTTGSTNFPTRSPFQLSPASDIDVFVSKLNAAGSALVYSSYLGGSANDRGYAIAVDSSGSAYLTGETASANFPSTAGAFQTAYAGGVDDAFVSKLNGAGSALSYSSYLGGGNADSGRAITVDSAGSAYLTGYTFSTDFPTTAGAFRTAYAGGVDDAFVSKLNAGGSALAYSSYLGGGGEDSGYGIAVDAAGSAYLTGYTLSTDFPITPGAFQGAKRGGYDVYVSKLNAAGSALVYSSYLGGSGDDYGFGIAVDSAGSAYLTGYTASTDFPTTSGAFQVSYAGGAYDAFVSKLNAAGSGLSYSSYLGGGAWDSGYGIAVDATGSAYLTGRTISANFPTASPFQVSLAGLDDAFASKLNAAGSALVYSSFLGGNSTDLGYGIAVDAAGSAYLTGETQSANFPTTSPFQSANAGSYDVFVTKVGGVPTAAALRSFTAGRSGRSVQRTRR